MGDESLISLLKGSPSSYVLFTINIVSNNFPGYLKEPPESPGEGNHLFFFEIKKIEMSALSLTMIFVFLLFALTIADPTIEVVNGSLTFITNVAGSRIGFVIAKFIRLFQVNNYDNICKSIFIYQYTPPTFPPPPPQPPPQFFKM